ncbi:MAG: hypothetical protein NWR72_05375, partial [Bacteroidia bacterium]|nr:hypothetical protein [Bacteroidia bacterium]
MAQSFDEFLAEVKAAWSGELARLTARYNVLSWSRAAAFLAGIGLTWWLFRTMPIGAIFVGVIALVAFLFLLKMHAEVANARDHLQRKLDIVAEEEQILSWQWLQRDGGDHYTNPEHEFSFDLDLFGRGSLFQYLHRHSTKIGGDRLANWLMYPPLDRAEIIARQAAVKELAAMPQWQMQLQAHGNNTANQTESSDSLLSWMKEPFEYLEKPQVKLML